MSIRFRRYYALTGAIISWASLLLQLWLFIPEKVQDVPGQLVQLFSYFTTLTNILVAICFTSAASSTPASRSFFTRPATVAATTMYIFMVGSLYYILIAPKWDPQGLAHLAVFLLHLVNPVLFILYWVLFVPKQTLRIQHAFWWLLYPLIYFAYILLRGLLTREYTYFFVDVNTLGLERVLLINGLIIEIFFLLSLLLIWFSKLRR